MFWSRLWDTMTEVMTGYSCCTIRDVEDHVKRLWGERGLYVPNRSLQREIAGMIAQNRKNHEHEKWKGFRVLYKGRKRGMPYVCVSDNSEPFEEKDSRRDSVEAGINALLMQRRAHLSSIIKDIPLIIELETNTAQRRWHERSLKFNEVELFRIEDMLRDRGAL